MDEAREKALDEFDEKFDEALVALLSSEVTDAEIDCYFESSELGNYIKKRRKDFYRSLLK